MQKSYKQTEIGKIPEEWEVVRLGDLCEVITKGTTPTTYGFKFIESGVRFIKVENIDDFGNFILSNISYIDENTNDALHRSILEENDILFSIAGALGRSAIITKEILPANTNQALAIIRIKNGIADIKYVKYYLDSNFIQKHIKSHQVRSAQANLSLTQVGDFYVAIPPLPEQQKIASILSTIDDAIQKTDEIIQKTQLLKKGLMQQLLTKGIGHTRFKKTEIGEIPEEWEVVRLEQISKEFVSGGTPSTSNSEYWDGRIPWMRSAWIKGRYVTTGERFITELGLKNSAANVVPKDNVIIATRVSMGNVTINKVDIAVNQDLTGIIIDKSRAHEEYVYWTLVRATGVFKSFIQGSTIKGILREDLKRLKIGLASLDEQKKIASILSEIDDKIAKEKLRKEHLEKLKKGLMQVLLTGKVRVKVD